MPYGVRLLECLLGAGMAVNLVYSQAAQVVAKQESGLVLPAQPRAARAMLLEQMGMVNAELHVYGRDDWLAPMASGSNPDDAMVVCPCSMGTLAAIAAGLADNLIERAADVALKEQKKLVLVVREAPFSVLHLENMLRVARAGGVIMPACPGFYQHPRRVEDLVDFVVARVLDQLCVPHKLTERWGEDRGAAGEGAA